MKAYSFNIDRKIIHVDMDAFFASVAQLDDPSLRGKAIAVGGKSERGVVAAASYEARKFGVRSAMSGVLARKLCPHLIFVPHDFDRYKEISQQIRSIFFEYTDLVEPLSLDEAYLDVTHNKKGLPSATLIAKEIRQRIFEELNLTASAGISVNKFIAKVASDVNKPNGQKTVGPDEVLPFLEGLEIKQFYGVGAKTKEKMYQLGIFTGADLKKHPADFLVEHFGKSGQYYYDAVRGIHNSPVKTERIPKSVGAERTFEQNYSSTIFLEEKLHQVMDSLIRRLERQPQAAKTITLKLKYSDFTVQTRSRTLAYYISDKALITDQAISLLHQEKLKNSVRLLGVSLSNFKSQQQPASKPTLEDMSSAQLQFPF
ncbi:MAG: DNA polymerase IV [Flavobacteriaceae bacterium]